MAADQADRGDVVVVLADWNDGIRSGVATAAGKLVVLQSEYNDSSPDRVDTFVLVPTTYQLLSKLRSQILREVPQIPVQDLDRITISPGFVGLQVDDRVFLTAWNTFFNEAFCYSPGITRAQGMFTEYSETVKSADKTIHVQDCLAVKWTMQASGVTQAEFERARALVASRMMPADEVADYTDPSFDELF